MGNTQTIIITGGSGFIGSAVVRAGLQAGYKIVNLDALTYAAVPGTLADVEGHNNYRFEQADIREKAAVKSIIEKYQPDGIIHLAAESHVDRSIDGPDEFITTNVMGTANLLQAAKQLKTVRFLHVSTDEVYGDLTETAPAFTESSPYAPSSPYSASKASSDHLVQAWGRTYDMPVMITHCSNNYGPYQYPEKLIPVVISKALSGVPIPVYGTGENIRDWLFVDDHARALWDVFERGIAGEHYNIGGDCERRNIDLVRDICGLLDELHPSTSPYVDLIKFVTDRPGHDQRYAVDHSKITKALNWKPQTIFNDGLRQTVQWYLDNQDWWKPVLEQRDIHAA